MMANGWLGNKREQGFYRKTLVDGQRQFWTLDLQIMDYQPPQKVHFDSVGAGRKIEHLGERLKALIHCDDRGAECVRRQLFFSLSYAAYVTRETAYSLKDVDDALRWGFGHEAGPFEIWDRLGVAETTAVMEAEGYEVADWVHNMLDAGNESFYLDDTYYDFESGEYCPIDADPRVMNLDTVVHEMLRQNVQLGMVTMCTGGGMGAAGIFENMSA